MRGHRCADWLRGGTDLRARRVPTAITQRCALPLPLPLMLSLPSPPPLSPSPPSPRPVAVAVMPSQTRTQSLRRIYWQVRLLSRGAARSPCGPHCPCSPRKLSTPRGASALPAAAAAAAAGLPSSLSSPGGEHGGRERRFVVRGAAGVPLCILSVQLGGDGGGLGGTGGGEGGGGGGGGANCGGGDGDGIAVGRVAAAQRAVLVEDVVAASEAWLEAADAPDLYATPPQTHTQLPHLTPPPNLVPPTPLDTGHTLHTTETLPQTPPGPPHPPACLTLHIHPLGESLTPACYQDAHAMGRGVAARAPPPCRACRRRRARCASHRRVAAAGRDGTRSARAAAAAAAAAGRGGWNGRRRDRGGWGQECACGIRRGQSR